MTAILDALTDWLPAQRWYQGKGSAPRLRDLTVLELPSADPSARIRLHLVADDSDERIPVYQVPIITRSSATPGSAATIGRDEHGGALIDAAHDPAFAPALIAAMTDGAVELGSAPVSGSAMSTAEQSNTSIVVQRAGAGELVVKLFRVVHHGTNPDAELQGELSAAGIPFVPRFFGQVLGEWTDGHGKTGSGHLAVVQEFVTGAQDGWRIAVDAAAEGRPFAVEAEELGRATAVMHDALADRLGSRETSVGDAVAMVAVWHSRLGTAVREAPVLTPRRAAIEALYDEARDAPWPRLQRIHGDLHLGQILRSPDGRWVFIDFEGEPLRPMHERTRPEPALRDVAGMLRSFDYAAASGDLRRDPAAVEPSPAAAAWSAECREAFLSGYRAAARSDTLVHAELLTALELDKAVYEVSYEARNRPTWIRIPLIAIERRITDRSVPMNHQD